MRPLPAYPAYSQGKPPVTKRWMGASALLVLISGSGIGLMYTAHRDTGLIVKGMIGVVILMGIVWLIRQLYYRVSVHNARHYDHLVEQEHQHWWAQHRQSFALQDMVLLGPAGTEKVHWLRLLNRENRLPEVRTEPGGKALRVTHSFFNNPPQRENQLAKMLALQWQELRGKTALTSPEGCYWQGSVNAWKAFREQMKLVFPDVVLPEQAQIWQGEATLSTLAALINASEENCTFLVAGCQSLPASFAGEHPAGESAFLWLAGKQGQVTLSRGEVFDAAQVETLTEVCERAVQQSELDKPPDACLLFTQPHLPELAQSGWNMTHHLQDLNWGDPGQMEMSIVLTLAAIYANQKKEPCGWMAKDPLHTLALGIIKPYGEGK